MSIRYLPAVSRLKGVVLTLLLLVLVGGSAFAGLQSLVINLAPLDGVALTPDNILGFQVQSMLPASTDALIKGTVRYRGNSLSFSYSFHYTIRPGANMISGSSARPQWTYSSTSLKELFNDYKKLPQGTYEYCVTVTPVSGNGEAIPANEVEECLYQKADDIFLINLVEPENNAKIYEYNPMLSWVVNYPFASALTYRVRVAEIKTGQNTEGAISRNNPVYQESNITQTSVTYPVYGKPLEAYQPYAWTVDAYYKGILLGGAQPWKFTIIEDSILKAIPTDPSYVELNIEQGITKVYAVGKLKLKFTENDLRNDSLSFVINDKNGNGINIKSNRWQIHRGDNRIIVPMQDVIDLKHLNYYFLIATSKATGKKYKVLFQYVNPNFLK